MGACQPLPGDFCIGDVVISFFDIAHADGKVARGDRGVVRGRAFADPERRVNCEFSGLASVNCLATSLRKADEQLPGSFRIGDAVISSQDFQCTKGKIVRGDSGTVRCHCISPSVDAKARVNCEFPGLSSADCLVTSLQKAGELLPGSFSIGDAVISLQDFACEEGKVARGDHGIVRCHCNSVARTDRGLRVNCEFPDLNSVNCLVKNLRKADEPLPGGFSIGDAVVCMQDNLCAGGKMTRGDLGTVRCHSAKGIGEKRVNCDFPGLFGVDCPVAVLRKADQPLAIEAVREASLAGPGYELLRLSDSSHPREWVLLEDIMKTDSESLGKGKDAKPSSHYDRLKLVRAWRVKHPDHQTIYSAHIASVQRQMEVLRSQGLAKPAAVAAGLANLPGLPMKTAKAAAGLCALQQQVSEVLLLHGTPKEKLVSILSDGLNERYSGTAEGAAFGDGIYLAEDIGKADQYVQLDKEYDPGLGLHRLLYGRNYRHPGQVYYALVCRAILGLPARTKEHGSKAVMVDEGTPVFPISFRELADVPGTTGRPIKYHSLIVECGGTRRYREVVMFHGERLLVEFVLAYQRFDGEQKAS